MRYALAKLCILLVIFGLARAVGAQAASVSPTDASQVQEVIKGQLDAFAADDAQRAFSYASPAIREMFGTPERFIEMVRTGYPMVYRPASVSFFEPEMIEGELLQKVRMTDSSGAVWLAIYRMQRQSDKSWRINGCDVVESAGRVT
jgi:hypothetical protein